MSKKKPNRDQDKEQQAKLNKQAEETAEQEAAEIAEEAADIAEEAEEAVTEEIEETVSEAADDEEEAEDEEADAEESEDEADEEEPESEPESKKKSGKKDKQDKEEKPKRSKHTPEEEKERALNRVKRRKKLKYGALATVITLVVCAIVVVVNIICNMLDKRFNLNIDMTSKGIYQLDEQTISYLNQLDKDVTITVLADESYFQEKSSMLKVAAETLTRFNTESNGHVKVEYVDPTKNPDAISKYSQNYSGDLSRGDLVITCGDLVRVVTIQDIIRTDTSMDYNTYTQNTTYTFIGEQTLISAIMGVTDLHPINIAVITKNGGSAIYNNYDEYNYAALAEILKKNNYNTTEIDIATDPLSPADYDCAILCSPYNDLTEAQIEKLTAFLNNDNKYGKNMIYFASFVQRESTPNLDAFLETWGLQIGKSLISESNDAAAQVVPTALYTIGSVPVLTKSEDQLNNGISGQLPIVGAYCCPVITTFESNAGRTTSPLLTTSDTCYLHPLDADDSFDADSAEHASYNVAVRSETMFQSGSDTFRSTLVAYGGAWFLDANIVKAASNYDNAHYFISVLNNMTGKENVLTVQEKSLDTEQISITTQKAVLIRNITVFVIPLTVALIGILVYVRRKNK